MTIHVARMSPRDFSYFNRRTRRPCKYPYQMVADARVMRDNGYQYREIATALELLYSEQLQQVGIKHIPWITVRDWVQGFYRMRG